MRTIRDRILRDERRTGQLLGLYQQVLQDGAVPADDSPEQMELRLSGLVVKRDEALSVYNPIYGLVFSAGWVAKALGDLRPYGEEIKAWLGTQADGDLLQGAALVAALDWAASRSLSKQDYEYLVESQKLGLRWELEEKQAAVAVVGERLKEANGQLSVARQKLGHVQQFNRRAAGIGVGLLGLLALFSGWAFREALTQQTDARNAKVERAAAENQLEIILSDKTQLEQARNILEDEKLELEGLVIDTEEDLKTAAEMRRQAEQDIRAIQETKAQVETEKQAAEQQLMLAERQTALTQENLAEVIADSENRIADANSRVLSAESQAAEVSRMLDDLDQRSASTRLILAQTQQAWGIEYNLVNRVFNSSNQQEFSNSSGAIDALIGGLKSLDKNTIVLYPKIFEDRLEILTVTPSGRIDKYIVDIDRNELISIILEFKASLESSMSSIVEVKKLAYELYKILIAPIELEIAQENVKTIVFAPEDSSLGSIPLSALHDGDQWLVERLLVNNITALSLTRFQRQRFQNPRILAGASSQSRSVQIGDQSIHFGDIPFATLEVERIADIVTETDLILNESFSIENILKLSENLDILHIATHLATNLESPDDSFIAFGNNEVLRLSEIGLLDLSDVSLVVLSASNGAVNMLDTVSGEETLGFAYQILQTGTGAVIASLFDVSDGGTQALFDSFYGELTKGEISIAEALRRAKISLIHEAGAVRRSKAPLIDREAASKGGGFQLTTPQNGAPQDPSVGLSHPYYWAPFIIIGNGL